jgi:hypothetical protein
VARGSARNASCHGRVVAGPEQGRHQRRRCPEGDRHRRRGPRRQPRATGPSGGGRPFEQSSAGDYRELGRTLVRVGKAIRVLHGSAFNSANAVPHAAGFYAVPVTIFVAVKNDVTDAERVYVHAGAYPERVCLHTDTDDERIHAHAHAERVYLHADTNDERIHTHAHAERVTLGADAHCFGVGLVTDFGIARGVGVDGSAVGVSRDLAPASLNGRGRRGWRMAKPSS